MSTGGGKPVMKLRAKISCASSTLTVLLLGLASESWAAVTSQTLNFPADSLHLVVAIDGSDDLHISQRAAKWVHKTWEQPTDVHINGYAWNPQQQPVLSSGANGWLLAPDLDLSGAVLHVLRGRGSVELGRDADGLVIHFDDPESGADTYEVEVLFAQKLAQKTANAKPLELRIDANIDGTDELWLAGDQGKWLHTGGDRPLVTINDRTWDVIKEPTVDLQPPLHPEEMDLQRATLTTIRGRGIVNLDYRPGQICLDFEDREAAQTNTTW